MITIWNTQMYKNMQYKYIVNFCKISLTKLSGPII